MNNLIKTIVALCLLASLMLAGCTESPNAPPKGEAGTTVQPPAPPAPPDPKGTAEDSPNYVEFTGSSEPDPLTPEMLAGEVASPLGCLKSKARYYDPKLEECVTVNSERQAMTLDAYREVHRLMEDGIKDYETGQQLTEGEFYINLEVYTSMDDVEQLWSELKEQGATILGVFGSLPDAYGYDNLKVDPNPAGPKTWGHPGKGSAAGCGWHYKFDPPSEEKTIADFLLKSIEEREANPAFGAQPERRKAILEDKDCRIDKLWVIATPEVIRDFWNRHLETIRGIQPQISTLDKAMPSLGVGPYPPIDQAGE